MQVEKNIVYLVTQEILWPFPVSGKVTCQRRMGNNLYLNEMVKKKDKYCEARNSFIV